MKKTKPGASGRITPAMRKRVMRRDGHTCQTCGAQEGSMMEDGRRAWLVVEHRMKLRHGGVTKMDNLEVACHLCHHGGRHLKYEPPSYISVKTYLNKATRTDQKKILMSLLKKYSREIEMELGQ